MTTNNQPAGRDEPKSTPRLLTAPLVVVAAVALVARFFQPSPIWGREAVEANLGAEPLGQLLQSLRHAGGPPLWIVMIHGWQSLVGDGDAALRALPAMITVATVGVLWRLGDELGGSRLARDLALVAALSPALLRYGSDAGPAAMVVLLVAVGALALVRSLSSPSLRRLTALGLVTSALLWTHYWTAPLLAGTAVAVLIGRRGRSGAARAAASRALLAMALGVAGFLPWAPTLLFQLRHAGTPWGDRVRPATILVGTVTELNGGTNLLVFLTIPLVAIGLFGARQVGSVVQLDLRGRPDSLGAASSLAFALVASAALVLVAGTAFVASYASGLLVAYVVLVGLGLSRLEGRARAVALVALLAIAASALITTFRDERSQARSAIEAIAAAAPQGALVVACPDEVGPSLHRGATEQISVLRYTDLKPAEGVDWVGHDARIRRVDPAVIATTVRTRAAGRPVFVAVGRSYRGNSVCNALVGRLGGGRIILEAQVGDFQELIRVYEMPKS
ncbi:MAG: glycosyltransferase family 39 protein [Microthrixaceae bacterium]|nr:glycosyltransferase family 39 protein [Microthrixaceae bacterium]